MACMRLFMLFATSWLLLAVAQLEESCTSEASCTSKDSRKGGSLIQLKSSSAPSANSTGFGDILMATFGSDEKDESGESSWLGWPFDSIADSVSDAVESVTGPEKKKKKKAGRFQKVNGTKGNASNITSKFNGTVLQGTITYTMLPKELQNMGEQFFGSKENTETLLANTLVANITYGGTVITIAYRKGDDVYSRFCAQCPQGEEYGLDKILEQVTAFDQAFEQRRQNSNGRMINMIDIGGHIGVVSLAVYKKYPGMVRSVVVEPVRLSYFYLMVNLWLNNVPSIPNDENGMPKPGITAIQKAVDSVKDQQTTMCVPGLATNTMSAFALSWSNSNAKPCNCCANGCPDACVGVLSANMDMVFGFFPGEDITLLKVDCEGCEAQVLASLENPEFGQRVKKLAVEMHNQNNVVALKACEHPNHQVRGTCPAGSGKYLTTGEYCPVCAGKQGA
mmetsp:Transcript_42600/g.75443  ORF Transcript_42600/g.75443 Transcript_42600/m.75443 type:complete len:450 (-) Transcript_42600:89-1438(-)